MSENPTPTQNAMPERSAIEDLASVLAVMVDLHTLVEPDAKVPPTMTGQLMEAHARLMGHIGDQAAALPPEERRRWVALAITSATAAALTALQLACALSGRAVEEFGFDIGPAAPPPAAPVLIGPDGAPVSAATAGDRRIITTLGG
jgi:hypothetical protein